MWLFFCYTIQLITINFVPNFRILTQVAAEKLTEKSKYILYKSERRKKKEKMKKEGKMRISILISIYRVHFAFLNGVH